jgi:methylthioribose-1-phosphate isomerase
MRERLLAAEKVTAIRWQGGALHLLDQRLLPSEERWLACDNVAQVAAAIRDMAVRGASAIGIAPPTAWCWPLKSGWPKAATGNGPGRGLSHPGRGAPDAANLFWALNRMRERLQRLRPEETCWRRWRPKRSPSMKATAKPT